MNKKQKIIVITGDIRQGKTTFVRKLADHLQKENLKVSGFLAIGKDSNGERKGFDLLNLRTNETITICTTFFRKNHLHFGRFYFDPVAFESGNQWLINSTSDNPDVIVIDEVGPLELNGKGWSPAMDYLVRESSAILIWIIRKEMVDKVLAKWNTKKKAVFDIGIDSLGSVINYILQNFHY